jgi:hypothetical protein
LLNTHKRTKTWEDIQLQNLVSVYGKQENEDLLTTLENIITIYKEKNENSLKIPISLFANSSFGIMETVVKFLREENKLNYSQIGHILKRDARTIWCIYKNCSQKRFLPPGETEAVILIPIPIFSDRRLSPLESLTFYLKKKEVSLKNISKLLNRDYRAIWLSYKHALIKVENEN